MIWYHFMDKHISVNVICNAIVTLGMLFWVKRLRCYVTWITECISFTFWIRYVIAKNYTILWEGFRHVLICYIYYTTNYTAYHYHMAMIVIQFSKSARNFTKEYIIFICIYLFLYRFTWLRNVLDWVQFGGASGFSRPVFYLWLGKILANERRRYVCLLSYGPGLG